MKIYVASSWRNFEYPHVVKAIREADKHYNVYDFRHPRAGNHGFTWHEIDPNWKNWTPKEYREKLNSPVAIDGFMSDMTALNSCDVCVLVLPCGRSAHLELGYAAGANKKTLVYMPKAEEPELMYRMCNRICVSLDEVLDMLVVFKHGEKKNG